MTTAKIAELARHSPLFRAISPGQLRRILKHFHLHRLEKGELLFRADQRSRVMYVLLDGRLRVEKIAQENQIVRIASLVPGDVVGEVAVLTGERHSGQVRAMTDAYLVGISKHDLRPVLQHYPAILHNLTKIEALRLRRNIVTDTNKGRELGFVLHLYATRPSDYQAVEGPLTQAIAREKITSLYLLGAAFFQSAHDRPAVLRQRLSKILVRHTSAYLHVGMSELPPQTLYSLILMADRLVLTISEDEESVGAVEKLFQVQALKNRWNLLAPVLSLVHHASRENLVVSQIEQRLNLAVRYRLRLAKGFWEKDDMKSLHLQCTTLARIICNTSQGIAFGGGGARALCEIGVLSELERNRIEFDHVAGTSMGSIIAAFYAMGLSAREMSERFREFLPSDKGLLRYNLPFISFYRDRSVNRILRRLFGKMRIEDLPKPLTIIAADLISGQEIRLTRGLIWRAIRASMSLPVIFAPVRYHKYYLVDGGALNNVPGNVLRDQGVSQVLGINCTPLEDNSVKNYLSETNLFQLIRPGDRFWSNLRRFFRAARLFISRPPILQIANRAMMLEGSELIRQKSREFDLLLSPELAQYGLFEFDRREEIIDSGRYYTRRHAADIKRIFRRS